MVFDFSSLEIKTPIATLGPCGTDAERIAKMFSSNIVLCDTFAAAMEKAYNEDLTALICCGFIQKEKDALTDCWVDLNFRYLNKMEIVHCFFFPTKPMCIAKRKDCKNPKSIIIHPSTETFVKHLRGKYEINYIDNKPGAVKSVSEGKYEMCIGSLDIVEKHDELEVLEVFEPTMVWSLYQRKN